MAKGSKGKPKTGKSLITSKAFKGIENVIGRVLDKLPSNVTVDATVLTQMACAGTAAYLIADDVARWLFTAQFIIQRAGPDEDTGEFDWELLLTQPGGLWRSMFDKIYGYDIADPSKLQLTPEELAELAEKIATFKMDEEHRMALALTVAALTPQAAELLGGIGKIIDGLVPF